jgi:hypothetical protein
MIAYILYLAFILYVVHVAVSICTFEEDHVTVHLRRLNLIVFSRPLPST